MTVDRSQLRTLAPTARWPVKICTFLLFAAFGTILSVSQSQAAQFPARTVRVVIPFSAGGAPDVFFRIVAPHLSEKWKQPVVIENRPGANTNLGTIVVTKSEPDGHTLLFTTDGTFIFNPLIYTSMPYSMLELAPVSLVATASSMFAIGKHVPARTVTEFIALAKSKPGVMNYGSTGPASIQRLQMEYFSSLTGVQLTHVPFKGANETTMAMLAGQIDASIPASSNILPHLPTGALRGLAITTATRSPLAPDVPTMQEAGVPGYVTFSLYGLFAPAGVPAEIREKLHADIAEVIARPETRKLLEGRGFEVQGKSGAEFQKIIDADVAKWRTVIVTANIKED